ncbi:MAG: NAD(P)-dependent oxidoreductase [Deltaproteobacteria bacterium]|nr:NAD(P)-dependent oxidoreductase [Deltaproteobacteria bacterium]
MSGDKVGFIGVGVMGKPMVENLLKKGFHVVAYDVQKERLDALQKSGAQVARSCKEAAELSDVIIVMVLDSKQAEVVILGQEGVLSGAKEGSVIIVTSTLTPAFVKRVAEAVAKKGVGFIDAPVSGGSPSAVAGTLTIMAGGEDAVIERCRPILEAVSKSIFIIGPVGTGQAIKLANQIIANSSWIATSEAVAMALKAGISLQRFLEIIRVSTGNTWAAQGNTWLTWWKLKVAKGSTSLNMNIKDIKLAFETSQEYGLNLTHLEALANLDVMALLKNVPSELAEEGGEANS